MDYTRRVLAVLACVIALSLGAITQTSSTDTQATTTTTTKKTTTKKKPTKKKTATKPQASKAAPATDASKPSTAEPAKPATPAKPAASGEQAKPATPGIPAKPAAAEKKTGPADVIILKGAPLGGVRFQHKAHNTDRKIKCETCHHPSKTEKPATAAQQACRDCHTSVAKPPMKTKAQAAFHNPTATGGTCIDCHKAENAKGKNAPTKCTQCHSKANA